MTGATRFTVGGRPIPAAMFAAMRDSTPPGRDGHGRDGAALRGRLVDDGYLLMRGGLDRDAVMGARTAVFERLAAVGEISRPAVAGIATGHSDRASRVDDLGAFWRTVSELPALRQVTHGARLQETMAAIIGEAARAFDFVWLRPVATGRASPLHLDHVYMNRGSERVLSVWIPLGDVPPGDGPIVVVEGSHRFADLVASFMGHDVDRDPGRPGHLAEDAIEIATVRGCRLLSADFRAGDIVVFGMFTLHGSCDNVSPVGRVRLSCDVRYQPAAEPVDERWVGNPPPGHGGGGYGAMSAARPLTAPPLRR